MTDKKCDWVYDISISSERIPTKCKLTAQPCKGNNSYGFYFDESVNGESKSCPAYNLPKELAKKVQKANLERQKSELEEKFEKIE